MTKRKEDAFAISLDEVNHPRIYFRTISLFSGAYADHGRDIRSAHPVISQNFERAMNCLQQPFRWVRIEEDLSAWKDEGGWALAPFQFAEQALSAFLIPHACVKSAIGIFWDVEIRRNRATSRRIPQDIRRKVLTRDKFRCLECRRSAQDGVKLTMHHVTAFSRGGETTEGNLVTLCEPCNQGHGSALHPHLFVLAGLDHGWDPDLLTAAVASDPDAQSYAGMLSQNIMTSCCRTNDVFGEA